MSGCRLCPRNCGVNRREGRTGYCLETDEVVLSRAALHYDEEPCISGTEGSGAVFFSGCNLRCIYCQNADVANGRIGKVVSVRRLSEIFLELQAKGANNINLVTPSHYVPQIVRALTFVKDALTIPVVYNTSSYEKPETLRMLDGLIDIYLPDFKYFSGELAEKYSAAPDYPDVAKEALAEMVRQVPAADFDKEGHMKSGVIVRHLILPGHTKDSMDVVHYLHETYGNRIYISLMNQYTPMPGIEKRAPELARTITEREYEKVVDDAIGCGVENGFIQEGKTADPCFIPAFDLSGV